MKLVMERDRLRIVLEGLERILALKTGFDIPLEHIVAANTESPKSEWFDLRVPGTYLPGVIRAGTYSTRKGKEFWYVTRGSRYLTIELEKESYLRIILGLPDNKYWAERLNCVNTIGKDINF